MIGTKLYNYISFRGIGTYEIIGEDGEFLMAKSCFCSNKDNPCIVKLNKQEGYKNRYKFVSMLQVCGDDSYENYEGEFVSNEYHWHNSFPFFTSKLDSKKLKGKQIIDKNKEEIERYKKDIQKLKDLIKTREDNTKEIELWINNKEA
jgi:hypothetical protein